MDDRRKIGKELVRIDRQTRQNFLHEEIMKDGFDGKTVLINAAHATFSLATTLNAATLPGFHSQSIPQ